jgi:hypothetical protein
MFVTTDKNLINHKNNFENHTPGTAGPIEFSGDKGQRVFHFLSGAHFIMHLYILST